MSPRPPARLERADEVIAAASPPEPGRCRLTVKCRKTIMVETRIHDGELVAPVESLERYLGAALLRRRSRGVQEGLRAAWQELLDPAKAR